MSTGSNVAGVNGGSMWHPAYGPVNYQTTEVSDDPDTQVAQVIGMMRGYAVSDSKSPEVQADSQRCAGTGDPIWDVWGWVKDRMRFVRDEETAGPIQEWYQYPIVETLVRPRDMSVAETQAGDCDDYSMYGAALLLSKGVKVSFCTVAADAQAPGMFSHVYLVAYPKVGQGEFAGQRVPMDLSHGQYPGWETDRIFRPRCEWPLSGGGEWMWLAAGAGLVAWALSGSKGRG